MADQSWINRACDLEAQGKLDEARELLEAHGAPEAWQRLRASMATFPEETWAKIEEMAARVRKARELPETDPKSIWARNGGDKLPSEIIRDELLRYWPDPIERRGRPSKRQAKTLEGVKQLRQRVKNGEKPTTAAKQITKGDKHQADHLVRILE